MSNEGGDDSQAPGPGIESLLAQLRRKSDQDSAPGHSNDLLSHFTSTIQHRPAAEQYYPQQQQHSDSPPNGNGQAFGNSGLPQVPGHFQPSLSSNLPSAPTPPVGGSFPNAQFPPSLLGSIGSGRPNNNDRATSSHLLNLLKFSGHSNPPLSSGLSQTASIPQHHDSESEAAQQKQQHTPTVALSSGTIHAPAPAPSDPTGLLAALMQGTLKDESSKPEHAAAADNAPQQTQQTQQQSTPWTSTSQSSETQQYLLNLLNRPKPSQNDEAISAESPNNVRLTPNSSQQQKKDYEVFDDVAPSSTGSPATLAIPPSTNVFDYQVKGSEAGDGYSPVPKSSMFHHHDPFDGLVTSPPVGATPKSSTTAGPGSVHSPAQSTTSAPKPVQILRKPASNAGKTSKPSSAEPSPAGSPSVSKSKHDGPTSHLAIHPSAAAAAVVEEAANEPEEEGAGDSDTKYEQDADAEGAESDFKDDNDPYAETTHDSANQSSDDTKDDVESTQEAVVREEIAMDLDDMEHAKTEEEFHAAAKAAGRAIQEELNREGGKGSALDDNLPRDLANAVRDIVDEAAHGTVADSWESADAEGEEIIVVEELQVPVRVYNFPMRPFISIDVQDDDKDNRPIFRDESILDIARLKKDFDQIDRNLVTASENYMAYGMSKAGGLRVIRQTDGRDVKLFTDTKDRIFNVAMSFINEEGIVAPKDSVIGTGVSGTVYWVQIRDGDKDHLDYTTPELCGFALPPILSHEGDAPGGVLKTRARTSSAHPEYFAVGRGKSINIVWPGFVMRNNLLLPGHDRVVDTEKLSKQCSLKISTGKAGKDFTFSQDDTVVVSLDKSGRVKFWDVRDLTAARSDGSANPMPAHTSLEVKEPLLTLTTTPEGEKAWPTSVLLLDKLRPYQKRCALRYMIVGMKQNHTLQLWDLALGKPVQEFNLPHSKESDAVCSVMYHPPTGMIIVGHPTRNSIYFLHLSAPKYAVKNMTQVEYIERLTTQDSSIPQPESTAVISGLREYSLSNRGALRSLDILENPAASADPNNPTLFELYAMHSKGVSCIFIHQAELGWTKDNKVLQPVDAVESGKVKIGKLKTPQQLAAPAAELHIADGSTPAGQQQGPRILASRSAAKELFQDRDSPVQDTPTRKPMGSSLNSKLRAEPKDEDTVGHPQPSSTPSTDKAEKKSRKKKAAAAANNGASPAAAVAAGAAAIAAGGQANREVQNTPNGNNKPPVSASGDALSKSTLNVSQDAIDTRINTMEARICERVSSSVHVAFDDMRKSIDQQFRLRDADFENKQRKLLDMVSNVLNSNTEQVLSKIVREEFDKSVVPVLRDDVARSVSDSLGTRINTQVSSVLQKELQRILPAQVTNSLRSQEVSKAISEKVVHAIANHVDDQFSKVVESDLLPTISSISAQAAKTITTTVARDIVQNASESVALQQKAAAQISELEQLHATQSRKIDSLLSLVTHLTETVATMATAQSEYQSQIAKLQGHVTSPPAPVPQSIPQTGSAASYSSQQPQQRSPLQQHQHQHHVPPPHQQQLRVQQQPHAPQQPHQHAPQHGHQHGGYEGGVQQQQQQQPFRNITNRVTEQLPGVGLSPSQHSNSSQQLQHQLHQQQLQLQQQQIQQQQQLREQQQQQQQQQQHVLYAPQAQEDLEREEVEQIAGHIESLIQGGKYDDAMMRWLQSNGKEEQLFRRVLVNHSPEIISNLQPLVLLSVGTTVTQDLDDHLVVQKLAWVEMVLLNLHQVVNQLDDQTREITPNVLMHIRARLEQTQIRIARVSHDESNYKNITRMIGIINRLVDATKPRIAF
ncbi:hypothetical protein HMPREF1624_01440 [Sporothrix schenckii ATCC 58251]|uniref:EDC4-like protein pdc1 beta-propeller domain-containing protein n=1 Tax=Sporothrix schenckii (strain ATCC 58251 / de Perez 2211183) TaxID=1391915 RepID=U7Q7V2_SPOS1|nr:hypothetical protein HMPREF1624_01440 [Sporothrix schenckii ATCC 58251]